MDNWIADMPKIELHCHLDGSMGLDVTRDLLAQRGEQYEIGELRQLLEAPMDCRSLAEYLEKFDLPIRCIQTEEGLRAAAYDLAASAAKEQVKYLEVRFAPSFSTGEGLSIVQILESVQAGLKEAEDEADIHTGIIVCGMRNLSMEENLSMLRAARELYGAGVVACDLAGDENAYPTAQFAEFFELAKKLGVPFTIHSGECGSTENIRTAIELGASRLGHGIAMAKDPSLMAECAEKRIGVELCPTSNLQTKAVRSMEEYPFMQFFKAGIPLSVNTDNRTVSRTTCTAEAALLQRTYQLSPEDFAKIYRDSVEMSFATDEVKEILLKKYRKL
jgi:adenosine deaminase